ncbi:Protein SET DOMAIN GROUP 40 [Abeliophyllum distichum]|uniref:Protein SET DOMAIN GROUP 40 n=1 Tax=Abeliophyllum distichum TaxID=126358 RepID=A0ABD1SUP8_9LAMI
MQVQDGSDLETFLQWAAALGVSDSSITESEVATCPPHSCLGHSLCVSHFPDAGGRGLAAVRDIMKGELILRVPKEALMTSESLRSKDQKLSSVLCKYPTLSSTQVLAVALLNEVNKGKMTWWYTYLKQLPRSYDIFESFDRLEIEALQMDEAIWTAERAVEKSKMDWGEASVLMRELNLKPQLSTFKAWLWASATISSRTMHIPWDSAGCLCPVGDFFNYATPGEEPCHSENLNTQQNVSPLCDTSFGMVQNAEKSIEELFDANAHRLIDAGYEEEAAAYCFYARRNYRKGDQVLLIMLPSFISSTVFMASVVPFYVRILQKWRSTRVDSTRHDTDTDTGYGLDPWFFTRNGSKRRQRNVDLPLLADRLRWRGEEDAEKKKKKMRRRRRSAEKKTQSCFDFHADMF